MDTNEGAWTPAGQLHEEAATKGSTGWKALSLGSWLTIKAKVFSGGLKKIHRREYYKSNKVKNKLVEEVSRI